MQMPAKIRSRNDGSVLLLTIAVMFLVAASAMGVLFITANALHLGNKQRAGFSAFNIAESGAEEAALNLKNRAYPPTDTSDFDPFNGPVTLGSGTYQVTIHPDPNNPNLYLKTYTIESVGTSGNETKTIQVVVRQASFGRYAYFTDKETSSISGGAIWWKAGEQVDGPAHSNNTSGSNFNINYNGSTAPIFLDMVTGAGSSINYSPSRPSSESTYNKIFLNGSKGYKLGVTPIPLPSSSDAQKNAAWGSSAGFPSSNGVYLHSGMSGGIYIRGDAGIQLAVSTGGNQQFIITQGASPPTTTTITLDKTAGTVSVSGPVGSGSPTSSSSLGNGVIYCSGNITSLKGQVADNKVSGTSISTRSAFTIATDVNAGNYVELKDNLTYHTQPDRTQSATAQCNLAAGTLGIVAKDIRIDQNAPANLTIDAVCLAGGQNTADGSFYVENYDSKTPTGNLNVLGGIIQKARGPVGTFNSSTGQTTTGYSKNYHYDPRLASDPPPYFPTTGQYERLSWSLLVN
jgi:hypothetical protein